MSIGAMTLGWRPGPRVGPALRRSQLPFFPLVVSAAAHITAALAIVALGVAWRASQPKTYIVNLVPAVAAIGVPQGRPTPTPVPPAAVPPRPPEPARPPAKAEPEPTMPPRTREPAATLPEPSMPPSRASAATLPERTAPQRPAALPKPGFKELPSLSTPASAPRTAATKEPPAPAPAAPPRREAPPPPLGRPTGSPQGTGALSLNVGDFPFAWYLRRIQAKIEETWQAPMSSREGQEAVAVFEIMRDGQVRRAAIERSSGDAVYDQAALRAITEANPFPPLPDDFREPPLRVHLGFSYRGRG